MTMNLHSRLTHIALILTWTMCVPMCALADVSPPLDAVSKWEAEGDAADSVGENDGTLINDTGFADGIVGQAFELNGSDQWVEVPSSVTLRPGDGSFSGSVWFRRDGPGTFSDQIMPLMAMVDGDFDNGWSIGAGGTQYSPSPGCGVDDVTHTISQVAGVPIPDLTFAHLVCVYDAANESLSLFVNGALQATAAAAEGPVNPSSDLYIGRYRRFAIGGRDEVFHGLIDDAQYFARVLSDEEVASIFMDVIPLTVGDVDCSGTLNASDALKALRHSVGLEISQVQPCPRMADLLAGTPWGDVDCTGSINATDALKVLRSAVGLGITQMEPCVDPGLSPL